MISIVGVKFQNNGKMYYFDSNQLQLHMGDYVIVDTSRGADIGEIVMGERKAEEGTISVPLKKVLRIATPQDISHASENRKKEKEAYSVCQAKIAEHNLEMKLVSVEYAFDNSKILFYFTANGRVDFRALVKDLASVFKTRIELRQIGVRDEAKMLGGLGPCGRQICCGAFLDEFQPVSIKMAKEQNLSLNPTKISGVCGRLMCCLKYEQEHYEQTRKRMPKIGREAITPDGAGIVTELNIVKETVFVRISKGDDHEIKEYPLDQITRTGSLRTETADDTTPEINNNEDTEEDILLQDTGIEDNTPDNQPEDVSKTKNQLNNDPQRKNANAENTQGGRRERPLNAASSKSKEKHERQRQLGQPVRRENTKRADRTVSSQAPEETQKTLPKKSNEVKNNVSNNWSAALEKAIREADEK